MLLNPHDRLERNVRKSAWTVSFSLSLLLSSKNRTHSLSRIHRRPSHRSHTCRIDPIVIRRSREFPESSWGWEVVEHDEDGKILGSRGRSEGDDELRGVEVEKRGKSSSASSFREAVPWEGERKREKRGRRRTGRH